jgi:hypothetical protein
MLFHSNLLKDGASVMEIVTEHMEVDITNKLRKYFQLVPMKTILHP